MRIDSQFFLALLAALVIIPGCGRGRPPANVTPVQEISVSVDQASVEDVPFALDDTDWNAWRGPTQNGHAPDQPVPTTWSETENLLWSCRVPGRGHSSPIVVGDTVFLATAMVEKPQQLLVAFNRNTGKQRWQKVLHEGAYPREIHRKGTNANGTCASDGERIFTSFLNNDQIFVSAVDKTGEVLWQQSVGAFSSKFGYAPSPVIYKSLVIVACDNYGGGYLAALNRVTGKIIWRKQRPVASSYSSPIIAEVNGQDQLLISGCDVVASYDPATGDELWSCAATSEATCGTMVTDGSLVFASGGHPDKQTICIRGDGSKEVLWSNRTKVYEPSMLLVDQHLYGITDDGIAYCWAAETGKVAWKERLGLSFSASPVLCNGLILIPSLSGETLVFKARADKYEEVSRNRLGDDTYASPALSNGQIFLRCGVGNDRDRTEKLYCIGT